MEIEDVLEVIKSRLSTMGIDYNDLEPTVQKSLIKIETEISSRRSKVKDAIEIIKANRININTIAKSGAISNKTVYKYEILVSYIKACEEEYTAAVLGNQNEEKALKNKLSEAMDTIRKLDLHTVEVELLKLKIDQLTNDAADDIVKITNLTEENMRLMSELQAIKKAYPAADIGRKGTIISMPGVTQK